jgi:flavin reductase (DIM6/NTAB) family NADH-FMN oxidoreductase RutF
VSDNIKVKIPLRQANRLINHGPVCLVSCRVRDGKPNCLPIAWAMPVRHEPPVICAVIGRGNYSFEWIRRNKGFVINIPPASMLDIVMQCGSVSGQDVDKFEKFNLTAIPAETVNAPMIKECIGHLECEVINEPSFIENYSLFIANVNGVWVEKDSFDEIWKLDSEQYRTIHHLGGNTFVLDGEVRRAK